MMKLLRSIYYFIMLRVVSGLNVTGIRYFFTGREYDLTDKDMKRICEFLLRDNFVGLIWRKNHFTSYAIALGHFLKTGRWSFWSHAWMSIDTEEYDSKNIKIFEAISKGALISPFWKVINCDSIILLKPKLSEYQWEQVQKYLIKRLGTKYDALCNEEDDSELNCVEYVVDAILSVDPLCLPNLSKMMKKYKCLTPQMLAECGDFKECLQIKR